jgi:hypothetical protein
MTEKIIEKISSYNIFNYLFPGVLFMVFAPQYLGSSLLRIFNQDLVTSLFLAYFVGMVVSRIGSIFLEKILRKIKFVKFSDHKEFLFASDKDPKLEILSSENNTYRTLISLFACLLFSYWFIDILEKNNGTIFDLYISAFIFSLIIFLLSYRKQTKYITDRISRIIKDIV